MCIQFSGFISIHGISSVFSVFSAFSGSLYLSSISVRHFRASFQSVISVHPPAVSLEGGVHGVARIGRRQRIDAQVLSESGPRSRGRVPSAIIQCNVMLRRRHRVLRSGRRTEHQCRGSVHRVILRLMRTRCSHRRAAPHQLSVVMVSPEHVLWRRSMDMPLAVVLHRRVHRRGALERV